MLGLAPAAGLFGKVRPQEDVVALIRYAVEKGGIKDLDTAPWYGCGKSEMDVGAALLDLQEHVSIVDDDNQSRIVVGDNGGDDGSGGVASVQERLLDALVVKEEKGGESSSSLREVQFMDSSVFWHEEGDIAPLNEDDDAATNRVTPLAKLLDNSNGNEVAAAYSKAQPPRNATLPDDDDENRYLAVPRNLRISTKIGRVLVPRENATSYVSAVSYQQYHPDPSFCSVPVNQPSLEHYTTRLQSRLKEYITADTQHRAKLQKEGDKQQNSSSPQSCC